MNVTILIFKAMLMTLHFTLAILILIQSLDYSPYLFIWFKYNHMKANPEKCHLLLSSTQKEHCLVFGLTLDFALMSIFHSYVTR